MVDGLPDDALGYNFLGVFMLDPLSGDRALQASRRWGDVPADMHVQSSCWETRLLAKSADARLQSAARLREELALLA